MGREARTRPGACRQGRGEEARSIIADAPARAFDMPRGERPRPTVAELARRDAVSCGTALGAPALLALLWMAGL